MNKLESLLNHPYFGAASLRITDYTPFFGPRLHRKRMKTLLTLDIINQDIVEMQQDYLKEQQIPIIGGVIAAAVLAGSYFV